MQPVIGKSSLGPREASMTVDDFLREKREQMRKAGANRFEVDIKSTDGTFFMTLTITLSPLLPSTHEHADR